MSATEPTATLGEIVADHPAAAALFEELGLDYCCGGGDTLERACGTAGLDVRSVSARLADALAEPAPADLPGITGASITQLCEHILVRRHGPLQVDLQRITGLLTTVVRVHGAGHPELATLQARFATVRDELSSHMRLEEDALFPACRALDAGDTSAFDEPLLALLEDDHDEAGAGLRDLRGLRGGYDTDRALCATHRALIESLRAFELELHRHVHEENNVLFPQVRARLLTPA